MGQSENLTLANGNMHTEYRSCNCTATLTTMRVVTWNINGVRAINKKGALRAAVELLQPDVLCLQEIRCDDVVAAKELAAAAGHMLPHIHWVTSSAPKKGYSGVAILSREAPTDVTVGFEGCPPEFASEGRVLTARFQGDWTIVSVYVPNSGSGRHGLRTLEWDQAFAAYCSRLAQNGAMLVCGDLNVAHQEIDIFHAASNHNSAGFTPEERKNFGSLLLEAAGLRDSFRELHPTTVKYSWFSYRMLARERNIGWRIDYVLASSGVKVHACDVSDNVTGSDHVPVWVDV